ncbi:glycosyltransferase [Apilactobacillus timberlakei]|nr:glycosyltransferase [Apilactobacillus timberlakei]
MIFFLNANFSFQNSGIEHAQVKRAMLFKKFNKDYKFIFHDWNPLLHHYLSNSGIEDINILNMFDYFQKSISVKDNIISYKDIDFGISNVNYEINIFNTNNINVTSNNKIIGKINLFKDKDEHGNSGRVKSVELFDDFGNLYRVNYYDYRGFLSMSQLYTPDNNISTEIWYDINGVPVVEDFFKYNNNNDLLKSGWRIIDSNKQFHFYESMTDMIRGFLNIINLEYFSIDKPNIYIMDRSDKYEEVLPELCSPLYSVFHLHNSQSGNAQKPMTSIMNNNYEYSITNTNSYDAVVTATEKQKNDFFNRFRPEVPIFTIPVGIIKNDHFNNKEIPMDKRKENSIVVTARISPEKQIDQIVMAVIKANKFLDNISLDVYGYVNDKEYMNKINKIVKDNDAGNIIKFHGYSKDVKSIHKNSQIYAIASSMEGFNLSLMEAQSEGDVGITYDTNYGPNELIQNKINGFVVKYGDYNALAESIVKLFKDHDLLQKMSSESYNLSKRYSEDNVWKKWKTLIDDAYMKWPLKLKSYNHNLNNGLQDMEHGGNDD